MCWPPVPNDLILFGDFCTLKKNSFMDSPKIKLRSQFEFIYFIGEPKFVANLITITLSAQNWSVENKHKQAGAELGQAQRSWDWAGLFGWLLELLEKKLITWSEQLRINLNSCLSLVDCQSHLKLLLLGPKYTFTGGWRKAKLSTAELNWPAVEPGWTWQNYLALLKFHFIILFRSAGGWLD